MVNVSTHVQLELGLITLYVRNAILLALPVPPLQLALNALLDLSLIILELHLLLANLAVQAISLKIMMF